APKRRTRTMTPASEALADAATPTGDPSLENQALAEAPVVFSPENPAPPFEEQAEQFKADFEANLVKAAQGDLVPETVQTAAPAPSPVAEPDPVQELIGLIRADVVDAAANYWVLNPRHAADALVNAVLQAVVPLLPAEAVAAEVERRLAAFGVQS